MHATGRVNATPQTETATVACRLNRELVRKLAGDRGWQTVDEIAEGLGIDRSTYFRMLSPKYRPLLITARSMARAAGAGITVDDLFPEPETVAA